MSLEKNWLLIKYQREEMHTLVKDHIVYFNRCTV